MEVIFLADSRVKNAQRNIISEMLNMLVSNILPFVTRTVMIYVLGKAYLGLNSLYTSILQVLSLAELGFGVAVSYSMYKPLANQDARAVNALLALYRKLYRRIGMVILACGLAFLPFLRTIIRGEIPGDVNIYVLYLVQLGNVVLSYFLFAYQQSLLKASQRSDIVSRISLMLNLVGSLLRIAALLLFRNYYLYCVVSPCVTAAQNLLADRAARKRYPQYFCSGEVPEEEKQSIRRNVAGLFTYKLCAVFRNSFDSIVLSAFMGLEILACYNNYYYILSVISGVMNAAVSSLTAGIGNKLVLESKASNYRDLEKFQLIFLWAQSLCTVCLYCLYQPFMQLWVGEDMMFGQREMTVFCVYFFVQSLNAVNYVYRQAAGLWWKDRFRPVVEAVTNLVLNVVLVWRFGVVGVLLSTIVCLVTINTLWGSRLLYTDFFREESYRGYLLRLGYYSLAAAVTCFAVGSLCSRLHVTGFPGLIVRGLLCVTVGNALLWAMLARLPEYAAAKQFVLRLLLKRR